MEQVMALRALLMDIDGTLIDTVELITQALNYTYRKHLGSELPKEELRRLIGLPLKTQMHYITCGRAVGVRVGAVGWGAHLPEDLKAAQPDYYFETPDDLLRWVRQLPARNRDGKAQKDDFRATRTASRTGND